MLLDGLVVPRWVDLVLRQIAERDFLDLSLVVLNAEGERRAALPSRLWHGRSRLLFKFYERLDAAVYGAPGDAFEPVRAQVLDGVPQFATKPLSPRPFEDRFDSEAIERVRAADLDVLLRFGFRIIRGEILASARYGVWSFHHGDSRRYRGGPAFFWEMYEGDPVTGTTLQILNEELDAGRVIYRSHSATDPVSLRRGRNRPYLKSANFVARRLTDLHRHGFEFIESLDTYREPPPQDVPILRTPTNRQMAAFFLRTAAGIVRRRAWRLALREEWFVAYRRVVGERQGIQAGPPFARLRHPPQRSFADPFVVAHDGSSFIFFEDYDEASGKGSISYVSVNGAGQPSEPKRVLQRDYHLSYPFVFEHDGEHYMIPETSEARRVELYRASRFPDEWELDRVLLDDIEAVDTTLFVRDGRFWLFTNVGESGGPTVDELFLFHAASLEGPWTAHPRNPVVSDVRRARPAGQLFEWEGKLLRPSQDCSARYGSAIVFNEVTRLTPDEYDELPFRRVGPAWAKGNLGSHTYNFDGSVEVVDGLAGARRYRRRSRVA